MKLMFLGSGSAFTVGAENFNSNMLLTNDNNEHLLLDCGSDIRFSTYEFKIKNTDINAVFISHFHSDHCGGLEWLGFSCRLDPHCHKPTLLIKNDMVDRLWDHVLSGGMSSFEGECAQLSNFFNVQVIGDNNRMTWGGIQFETIQTVHVIDNKTLVPSYGLLFRVKKHWIFITFDTQFVPENYMPIYKKADLIFHDCETRENPTKVHSHFNQLITLPDNIRKKMWLYHYDPGPLPDAKAAGFKGFVAKGQTFDLDAENTYQAS